MGGLLCAELAVQPDSQALVIAGIRGIQRLHGMASVAGKTHSVVSLVVVASHYLLRRGVVKGGRPYGKLYVLHLVRAMQWETRDAQKPFQLFKQILING